MKAATATEPLDNTSGTLSDRLFEQLSRAIVEGVIPPGSKISEPELAKRYNSSRGPLREAISNLEAKGLVVRRHNVGARVISLSSQQLIEIYRVREALEGMAARLAAEHMEQSRINELRQLLENHKREIERSGDSGRSPLLKEGDLDFHYRIVQGSENGQLITLLCHDLYHLVRMYRYQFSTASKRARQAMREHNHLLDAIESRDGELAELLMRHHIRASRKNLEKLLEENAP